MASKSTVFFLCLCRLRDRLKVDQNKQTEYTAIDNYTKHLKPDHKRRFIARQIKKFFKIEPSGEIYHGLTIVDDSNLDCTVASSIISDIEKAYTWCVMKVKKSTMDKMVITVASARYQPITIEICFKTHQIEVTTYSGERADNLSVKFDSLEEFRSAIVDIVTVRECQKRISRLCLRLYHLQKDYSTRICKLCACREAHLRSAKKLRDQRLQSSCSKFVERVSRRRARSESPPHQTNM